MYVYTVAYYDHAKQSPKAGLMDKVQVVKVCSDLEGVESHIRRNEFIEDGKDAQFKAVNKCAAKGKMLSTRANDQMVEIGFVYKEKQFEVTGTYIVQRMKVKMPKG